MEIQRIIGKCVYSYLSNEQLNLTPSETSRLIDAGYINSAGNAPTTKAFKYYLEKFVEGKAQLSITHQLDIDNTLKSAAEVPDLFSRVIHAMSKIPKASSFLLTHDGSYYVSGLSNLFDNTQLNDYETIKSAFSLLETPERLMTIIESDFSIKPLSVKVGDDLKEEGLTTASLISRYFIINDGKREVTGYIGTLSSIACDYDFITSYIDYVTSYVEKRFSLAPSLYINEPAEVEMITSLLYENKPVKEKKIGLRASLSNIFGIFE